MADYHKSLIDAINSGANRVSFWSRRPYRSAMAKCTRCKTNDADPILLGRLGEGHVCGDCWQSDRDEDARKRHHPKKARLALRTKSAGSCWEETPALGLGSRRTG
jgi:hypothetical protein